MSRRDLKHIRVGNEVFLKTQLLKKMSEEIYLLSENMVGVYASAYGKDEVARLEEMIRQRSEIITQLTN
ncbi:hypothetical protein ACFOEK_01510 [Litoribrevibacter euphylliae]|uniref:Uncharacterized protein n=1 Tax=Litoribrevibacter euphylliae TaxID=1834034 RepID=A0ABV7HAG8_9GAMM